MRRLRFLSVACVIGTLILAPTSGEPQSASGPQSLGLTKQDRREKRQREFLTVHTDNAGYVRPDLWQQGVEQLNQMPIVTGVPLAPGGGEPSGLVGVQWKQIGPAPLRIDAEQNFQGAGPASGEVVDIAIDPRNTTDQVIYISTNDGGIWKSTDGGTSWKPKTDFMPSLSMGAVALDPGNPSIVYAGTGNLFDGGGVFFRGVGIYKSIDAGETWSVLNPGGIFSNRGINRIVFPAPNVLLVATNVGLFRSVDGGLNFGSNSPTFNNGQPVLAGFISDLRLDTTAAGTVHAAVRGTGIFRSTDSGVTFPTNLFLNPGAPAAGTFNNGFISFAQSTAPNNQRIYASVQASAGGFLGLFQSNDGGGNWAIQPAAAAAGAGCQCGYDQTIGVDPQNANRVYIGFQQLFGSTNGGAGPFTNISANQVHFDHHALVFTPASHISGGPPTRFYVGTDGGISRTDNGGGAWANINEGIATNIFLSIDIGRGSAANNAFTYGGTQDTGTIEHRPPFPGTDWHLGIDGDGGTTAVDPCNPNHAVGVDNGAYSTTTNGGANWAFNPIGLTGVGVLKADPNCNVFYAATGTQLRQSTDNGGSFTSIHTFPSGITAIATVGIDSNTLWVGLANNTVQRTSNALAGVGSTWTALTVTGAPNQAVAGLAIDPTNTAQAVVVYPGFCGGGCAPGNRTRHVFRTTDNGATWTDISGTDGGAANLPDLPLHSVVIDPGTSPHTIIVASDAAVLRTPNLGATWQILGVGFPTVDALSLAFDAQASPPLLRVGTYGRSVFELTAATGPLLSVDADLAFGTACVGTVANRIARLFNVGSADLHITNFFRISGSSDFNVSGPATPVTIRPGEHVDFTISFQPSGVGNRTAIFQISSDDPFQPELQLSASGTATAGTIQVPGSITFPDACLTSTTVATLNVCNTGACNLQVSGITSSDPQFVVTTPVGGYPVVISHDFCFPFQVRFTPASQGPKSATLTISSNDPTRPTATVGASGTGTQPPTIQVTGSTTFGNICAEAPVADHEHTLTVSNLGACDLNVTSAAFPACSDFTLFNNPFPRVLTPQTSVTLGVRFTPTSAGPKTCNLAIASNDPNFPVTNRATTGTTPLASISVPPDQSFPPTVIQSVAACQSLNPFPVTNTGTCNLIVTNMAVGGTNPGDFALSGLPPLPVTVASGQAVGGGALNTVFAPTALDRNRLANVNVTYESDPITHVTANGTPALCGEGVTPGARVVVRAGGVPTSSLIDRIQLFSVSMGGILVDEVTFPSLQSVSPAAPCQPFQFHREYGTVSNPPNPFPLPPGLYEVRVQAFGGERSVMFDIFSANCDFSLIAVDF